MENVLGFSSTLQKHHLHARKVVQHLWRRLLPPRNVRSTAPRPSTWATWSPPAASKPSPQRQLPWPIGQPQTASRTWAWLDFTRILSGASRASLPYSQTCWPLIPLGAGTRAKKTPSQRCDSSYIGCCANRVCIPVLNARVTSSSLS
jgi:hypothetical protein